MARNLKDAFYNAQFRVGQGIYTRAVSQGDNSLTESNFTGIDTFDTLIEDDTGALPEFVDSQISMSDAASNGVAMNKISASQTAMDAVAASQTAMDAVAASQTAMDAVIASQLALDTVVASQTAMDAVAASQTAMDAVAASQTAMDAVAASQTAMDAVMPTLIGRTTLLSSSNIVDSIYSEVAGSEGVWEQFAPSNTIPFTYSDLADVSFDSDTNNGSGSAVVITSTSNATGSTDSDILSTTIDFTSINQLSIRYKDDGTTGGLVIDIDGTNEITQFNTSSYTEFTIDTSGYSGELTLDIGTFTEDGRVVHFDELKFIEA